MKNSFPFLPLTSANNIAIMLVALLSVMYCTACNEKTQTEEHPAFTNTIRKMADTLQEKYRDYGIAFTDAAFNGLQNPSLEDILTKDSILGHLYANEKQNRMKAISYQDSIIFLIKGKLKEEKYAKRYETALYAKGDDLFILGRTGEAFHYFTLAREVSLKKSINKYGMAFYNKRIGYLLFRQEKYLAAASYFIKQYNLLSACNCGDDFFYLEQVHGALNNTAGCYLLAGLPDSADWYNNISLKLILKNESKFPSHASNLALAKAVIYGGQAYAFKQKGKYKEAEELYNKSIAGTRPYDTSYTENSMAGLVDLYLLEKKTAPARNILNQLRASLNNSCHEIQLILLQKLNAKYYAQKNQFDSAFRYQQKYEAMKDAVNERDKKFSVTDPIKEFENLELKYSNQLLQKEDRLKNIYLFTIILILGTAAGITIFIWYSLKRTRSLHLQLQQRNADMQTAFSFLEQSHRENSRIMHIMAHDLKKPISIINNHVHFLLRKNHPEDLKETLLLIKTACNNSMEVIRDSLHTKKSIPEIKKELVNMKKLLEYCIDLLQARADEKGQQLFLQAEHILLMLNRQKVWRVVSNLVNNAIKFSPENTAIDIKLQRNGETVLLSVQDNGIGIPATLKDHIFTLSPEAARPGTGGEESYGLGLTISRKIIEEHEGKIWFDDAPGGGAVFYVQLPLQHSS